MTVREAFSKAYGPVPEGATCHAGIDIPYEGTAVRAIYAHENSVHSCWFSGEWDTTVYDAFGPDISDRPASAFLGFFGPEYDAVVNGGKS